MSENLYRRNFLKVLGLGVDAVEVPRHPFALEKGNVGKKRLNTG